MNAADFDTQFNRLLKHFMPPNDVEAESVELFKAVGHYHVDALDHAVTEVIRSKQDRFWPALGMVLGLIKTRINRYDKAHGKCDTCNGTTWIEAAPWKSNGYIYTGFTRCHACGVPAPEYTPVGRREELTAVEYQAWRDGTWKQPPMPDSKPNPVALEVLQHINPKRGRMARAIDGAMTSKQGAA